MNSSDPLAQLRGLHLPEATSWFPPAIGWWIITVLGLAAIGFIIIYRHKTKQQRLVRQQAINELDQIATKHQRESNDQQLAIGLNQLLKRCALAKFPRQNVAALSGDRWLNFLDQQLSDKDEVVTSFSSLNPRLDDAIFAPSTQSLPAQEYLAVTRQWVRRVM